MTLAEIFHANRPTLSLGSIRTYCSLISNLAKQMNLTLEKPADVIQHYKDILEALKDLPPRTRKTRLAALVVFIDKHANSEHAVETFRKQMLEDISVVDKENDEQQMTERQKEGLMSMKDIKSRYNLLKKEVTPLLKLETLDKRQFQRVQLYVLLSCLLLIPPRRSLDWTEFKLRNTTDADNYMKIQDRKAYLVFNVYKTARKYGQQLVVVPPTLRTLLTKWKKLNPHDYLLMNVSQQNKITSATITQLLHEFFERPLSTSMLRHIFLTEEYKDMPAIKEIKQRAHDMGHDMRTALTNYVKKS